VNQTQFQDAQAFLRLINHHLIDSCPLMPHVQPHSQARKQLAQSRAMSASGVSPCC
jgi:hypothetical protein